MDWARDREIWPNAQHSRFVDAAPHRWHVQVAGSGPTALLLHGAGGATQSWRGLLPLLLQHFHVVAPDLPGQGFTKAGTRTRCGLEPMAEDTIKMMRVGGWRPDLIIGHSAGAVLGMEIARREEIGCVIGINAALGKFEGMAGWLFPLMAKAMSMNPLIPTFLAKMSGGEARARELLASTGSNLDDLGVSLYRRLMADAGHIDGTLAMMARWDIDPLLARLPEIEAHVTLITGDQDGTVPPDVSAKAQARLPQADLVTLEGLGHLAHEEAPERIETAILAAWAKTGATAAQQTPG